MLQKKGKSLPPGSAGDGPPRRYAEIISLALKTELDDSHRTIKTVQRWTKASERSVKNWISGSCGPDGDHLIALLIHSDTILQMLLIASRRLNLVEFLLDQSGAAAAEGVNPRQRNRHGRWQAPSSHVPDGVPEPDPGNDPDHAFMPNERQSWFLAELAHGQRASARAIAKHFGVAEKTAKRDIASLKTSGIVQFVGARRNGAYVLAPSWR